METYIKWKLPSGKVYDPWLRVHFDLGAKYLTLAECSIQVIASVGRWQKWTGMKMYDTGEYIIQGALVPVHINTDLNLGIYSEPNVWLLHRAKS